MLKKLIRIERGQDLVEYALLASFLSISAISVLRLMQDDVARPYSHLAEVLMGPPDAQSLK